MAAREGRKHCGICRPIGPVSGHAQCKAADVVEPRPFIVAMGASAGGLEALERFFGSLPSDTGMAFVVIQHLSPDFKSLMDEILSRRTTMPVRVAEDGSDIAPNTVLLNPPKKMMTMRDGRIALSDKEPSPALTYPIDQFFVSMAAAAGNKCAALVLSGTGSDGSRGVADVHRAGGLVIAQAALTAGFDGMPHAAVGTGAVDLVLAPEDMPEALRVFFTEGRVIPPPEPEATLLHPIDVLLRNTYGVNFAEYKLPTIQRRTERRMQTLGFTEVADYVEHLARDPAELDALYRDLLIGVTQFFRDPEAFEQLARALSEQIRELAPTEEVRAWVAGCATGEEAYSIAITIRELLEELGRSNPVKIFATDIHREALRIAAAGVYDASSLAMVTPERRARFFLDKGGDAYQIEPAIRGMVVFAPHNLLEDVPFNRLDLVTCRNLLIYLKPEAQQRVLETLHTGLEPRGLLFLGASETLAELASAFEVVDVHWKLFRKTTALPRSTFRLRATANATPSLARLALSSPARNLDSNLIGTYDAVLDALVPPTILINARRELVHSFAGASTFLRVPDGRATRNVIEMLGDDLRVAVTGALERVFADHARVQYRGLRVGRGAEAIVVDITVREIVNQVTSEPYALVSFDAQRTTPADQPSPTVISSDQLSRDQVVALETELRIAKENLQTTIEELETSNEELQATNEELIASNEELQTTNEELHSVNEELFTVNTEFQRKIGELTQLTNDMDLLLSSTEVHTLFLDKELRVRRFTPLIAEVFHLVASDIGRSIEAFNHSLRDVAVYREAASVISTGRRFEHQVHAADEHWYLLRITPYRRGSTTEGAVLTLVDITNLKRLEAEAQSKRDQLASILANSPDPVWIRDLEGRYVVADESFRRLSGRDPTGLRPDQLFSIEIASMLTRDDSRIVVEGVTIHAEETIPTPSGSRTYLTVKFPMADASGRCWGIGGIQHDVTALKQAEAEAHEASNRRDHFLATLSHELRNPLAAILNAARVLDHSPMPPTEASKWQRIMLERAQHMTKLVDDLLDVSRLTQNKLALKRADLDLCATAQGVLEEVEPEFRERDVRVEVRTEPNLLVHGDATRLHQLQVNLLINAARHAPAGSVVTYTFRRDGEWAEICVADTGSGVAPEMLDKIFELFVQADRPGAHGGNGGLGVGLALVRRIAELHGGQVSVKSAGLGRGAEFRVRIPLVRSIQPVVVDVATTGRPRSVLLVDDDTSGREAMAQLLEFDGITVVTAKTGREALVRVTAGASPDVVLLDLGMPEMDGFEICRRMREQAGGDSLLILALTGFGQDSDREATRRGGFDGHLTKPVDVDEVYALYSRCRSARGSDPARTEGS